ncbi:MAG: tail fiber domain-containing protein, partial [Bdellovibrionales bacterium]|nr:tail fiber domain-containing protein [Bdellovibrionales bacterium]NQZ19590.1 tail fiber domain-containing protein [Bdellovibrionales bacterium]
PILLSGGHDLDILQGDLYVRGGGDVKSDRDVLAARDVRARASITTSDARLKKLINALPTTHLKELMNIKASSFQWKEFPELGTKWGFIAQQIEQHLPELVSESEEGIKGIDYQGLVALLVLSHQELSQKVEKNTARLNQLEKILMDSDSKEVK